MVNTPDLTQDAEKLASGFEKVIGKLGKMNDLLGKFSTALNGTTQAIPGGTGGVGAGNPVNLGTNGANFGTLANRAGNALAKFGGPAGAVAGAALRVGGAAASGINAMMPDMGATFNRASGYYNAAIYGGFSNRKLLEQTTLRGLGNGMTSVGSDSAVAQIMAQSGIMPGGSTYKQNLTNVSNSALLYGISNEQAASSLAGLTAGPSSGMLMSAYGISTSDAKTGKMLSEQQIFEQFYQRATAGRGKATVAETQDSLHRGFLGQAISNSGLDVTEQRKLSQYFLGKAGGKTIDLSNDTTTQKLLDENAKNGNANPLRGVYQQNQISTRQMGKVESGFIGGLEAATSQLEGLADAAGNIASIFSGVKAYTTTAGQNPMIQGLGAAAASALGGGTPAGTSSSSISYMGKGGLGTASTGGGSASTSSVGATASGAASSVNGAIKMIHPVPGARISLKWGVSDSNHGNGHNGVDYAVAPGTTVFAAADGKVTHASGTSANTYKTGNRSLGLQIHIDHGNGVVSIYGHLSGASVSVGQQVTQGSVIGSSGNSGFSTGPHLHFQVNLNGKDVNPENYLGASNANTSAYSTTSGTSTSATSSATNPLSTSTPGGVISNGVSGVAGSASSVTGQLSGYSAPSSPFSGGGSSSGVGTATGIPAGYNGSNQSTADLISGKPGAPHRNNVQINLTIAKASDTEAQAFAQKVKRILEQDTLMNNMGAR